MSGSSSTARMRICTDATLAQRALRRSMPFERDLKGPAPKLGLPSSIDTVAVCMVIRSPKDFWAGLLFIALGMLRDRASAPTTRSALPRAWDRATSRASWASC